MPINPNIALGVQPMQFQMPDPNANMNALARALQIKGLSDESKLRAQDLSERNALNEAYRNALGADGQVDQNKLFQTMAERGLGSKIPALRKTFLETDEARGKVQEQARKGYALFQNTLGAHASNPNPTREGVLGSIQALVNSGSMDRGVAGKLVANMPEDPQQLRGFLQMALKTQMTPEQQLTVFAPKPTQVDNGQQIAFRDTNPNSPTYGQATAGGTVQKVATPEALLTDRRAREEGALNRDVTIRGQDKTDQRARDFNEIQQGQRTQKGVIELRKEFNALPEVKNFKEVIPIIQSVQRAPNTPAGDIDLIYAVGKVMDPNSVVREGEMNLVIKSGSPAQRLQGLVNYVRGGGRLSPGQRQELMQVLGSRFQGLKSNYDSARKTYEVAADRQSLPKEQIFIENDVPSVPVDFNSMPTGGGGGGGKVINFGDLK